MKLFTVMMLSIVCASVFAQDPVDNRVHFACVSVTPQRFLKCQSTPGNNNLHVLGEDKRFTNGAEFARHAHVGDTWWPVGNGKIVLTMAALDIRHDEKGYATGAIYRLTGNVEIHTPAISVFADGAVYHAYPEEIEAHGNVRVKPVTPGPQPVQ